MTKLYRVEYSITGTATASVYADSLEEAKKLARCRDVNEDTREDWDLDRVLLVERMDEDESEIEELEDTDEP